MKSIFIPIMLGILLTGSISGVSAQKKETRAEKEAAKQAAVKSWLDAQQYVFVPQSALPMSGRTVQLSGEYSFSVTKDSLESYLPYYGRAYTAPMDVTKSPLTFKSKQFGYKVEERKKGGWDITITVKDQREIATVFMTMGTDGYGSLQVTSNNRQPINFNGYFIEKKDPKTKSKSK
ncbi:DUF4251 domain-containing protein [Chitinophaga sp. Cy-1792]|uniref:DUF4251 domain-containing protein n=1 Tax=Chitinophaga sp. Cy-1792 TaxID=2608339 RepID=UPI00141E3079|nr:DUF4251 domain-containing protein [Chitinophaga sp. Cy-1792]